MDAPNASAAAAGIGSILPGPLGPTINSWISAQVRRLRVENLAVALRCCDVSDDGLRVRNKMVSANFDVLGLRDGDTVIGYVTKRDLSAGTCREFACTIADDERISGDVALIDVLERFVDRPYLFVEQSGVVTGILSRADLRNPPVRVMLYMLVEAVEEYTNALVRGFYPNDRFLDVLDGNGKDKARLNLTQRRRRSEDLDMTDCLRLSDKMTVLSEVDGLRRTLGFDGKPAWRDFFKRVDDLRQHFARLQDFLSGPEWQDSLKLAVTIQKFLDRCESRWTILAEDFPDPTSKR